MSGNGGAWWLLILRTGCVNSTPEGPFNGQKLISGMV